jgi:hypothetical protein
MQRRQVSNGPFPHTRLIGLISSQHNKGTPRVALTPAMAEEGMRSNAISFKAGSGSSAACPKAFERNLRETCIAGKIRYPKGNEGLA